MNNLPSNSKYQKIYDKAFELVETHFKSGFKTSLWMNSKNSLFGGLKPIEMIELGNGERLLKIIKNLLDENER